jgi:hypothetical protein
LLHKSFLKEKVFNQEAELLLVIKSAIVRRNCFPFARLLFWAAVLTYGVVLTPFLSLLRLLPQQRTQPNTQSKTSSNLSSLQAINTYTMTFRQSCQRNLRTITTIACATASAVVAEVSRVVTETVEMIKQNKTPAILVASGLTIIATSAIIAIPILGLLGFSSGGIVAGI